MALGDQGLISLDDPASKYLPKFTGKKGAITIRQLFSHTHGLPQRPPHHRNTRLTLQEAVDKIADVPLAYDPGTQLVYSGLGMQVAARIAELASGKSWVDIFQDKIARPLEMERTTYFAFGRTDNPNVAGSVDTCIDDYGNFVTMVLNRGVFRGKRVLSEQAVETMLTNQSGDVPIRRHPWQAYSEFDPRMATTPYGIGCWLEEVHPETGKAWRASSGGAFGCQPFVDLKRNVAGVFLPYARSMKRSSNGLPYNDASVVYLELRGLLNAILDGKPVPEVAAPTAIEPPTTDRSDDSEIARQVDRIFQFADGDGDGQLAREELPERMQLLRRAFDRFDRDGDGKLSRSELSTGWRAVERLAPADRLGEGEEDGAHRGGSDAPRDDTSQRPKQRSPAAGASDSPPTGHALAPRTGLYGSDPGSYAVESVQLVTLHDRARGKDLQVRVSYPKGDGPFPVILFSHCVGGSSADYRPLVDHWVAHGYVCLQADHADSRLLDESRGRRLDFRNRAADLSFLIDSLSEIERRVPAVQGKLDANRIGAGGHLIGAYAACLLVGMKVFSAGEDKEPEMFEDDRVAAALLLSPQGRGQGLTDRSWEDISKPMLVIAGSETPSRRTGNPADWRTEPFTFAPPGDKCLIVINGLDSRYAGLIIGTASDEPVAAWIKSATLAFWDAHLKQTQEAQAFLKPEEMERASNGDVKIYAK